MSVGRISTCSVFNSKKDNTVGALFEWSKAVRLVNGVQISNGQPFENQTMASLGRFYKKNIYKMT